MLKKFSLVIMLLLPMSMMAQSFKFGHTDSSKILELMPERKKATAELDTLIRQLETEQQRMVTEFQTKYEDFLKQQATMPQNISERRQKELQELQNRMQEYDQDARQQLQAKNTELMQPIVKKLDAAISSVGQEGGFIYIFDMARTPIAYVNDAHSTDVTAKVKAKLGIVE